MEEFHPRKRARVDVVVETPTGGKGATRADGQPDLDDEDVKLQEWMYGDDFITTEQQQAMEAERRRAERRERLKQRLAANANRDDGSGGMDLDVAQDDSQIVVETIHKRGEHDSGTAVGNKPSKVENQDTTNHRQGQEQGPRSMPNNNTAFTEKDESGIESFDMFTSSPPPPPKSNHHTTSKQQHHHYGKEVASASASNAQQVGGVGQSDWDDAEGYYNAVIGEIIQIRDNNKVDTSTTNHSSHKHNSKHDNQDHDAALRFRVDGLIGRGVFSTVLKVTTLSNSSSTVVPPTVAIKMIRSNETMAKAATNEIRFLHQLRGSHGIVPLLLPTNAVNPVEHRGHVMLVFPHMEYNLRDVLQKFGKGVGLSLPAVRSYFGQLLAALTHLKKQGIIHADLKPDNILVSADFATVHLADFGSAFEATAPENQPTPYLVSRFYRAPEIILGLTPTIAIDLWSLAVSIAELFLGNVLFRGKSNNDMLYVFMQHLGAFSNRMVRQHMVQLSKLPTLVRQFQSNGANFVFLQQTIDTVTGDAIHKRLPLVTTTSTLAGSNQKDKFPLATPLPQKILRAKSANDARVHVQQFADLLQKCLALDPGRRIALKDALGHNFFRQVTETTTATETAKTTTSYK